jgi:hypothetical protein
MATTRRRSSSRTRSSSKRGAQKRDTVKSRKATFYSKRTSAGRFKQMDEQGRALASDRRGKAETKTRSGYGDRGDRQRPKKAGRKKGAGTRRRSRGGYADTSVLA